MFSISRIALRSFRSRAFQAGCVALVMAVALPGCVRRDERRMARGNGTGTALVVAHNAWRVAGDVLVVPPERCRRVRTGQTMTVRTRFDWEMVRADGAVEKITQENTWRQDAEGNRAYATRLGMTLPDGRPAIRSSETRQVGGRFYRAIDERFVEADLVPFIARELDLSAFSDLDSLLSRVERGETGWHGAVEGESGVCVQAHPGSVATPDDVWLEFDPNRRSGRLVYGNGARSGAVTLRFEERVRYAADPVEMPTVLWPVVPEPGFENADALRERGLEEGWLRPARVLEWMSGQQ